MWLVGRANVASSRLPENYNAPFDFHHLRQWRGLALVAQHVDQKKIQQPFPSFPGSGPEPKFVPYVLGKVEERPIVDYNNPTKDECSDANTELKNGSWRKTIMPKITIGFTSCITQDSS